MAHPKSEKTTGSGDEGNPSTNIGVSASAPEPESMTTATKLGGDPTPEQLAEGEGPVDFDGIVTEGDLHAARDALKVDRMHGHTGTLAEWEASEDGRRWLEGEDERKRIADEENAAAEEKLKVSEAAAARLTATVEAAQAQAEQDAEDTREANEKADRDRTGSTV